MALPSLNDFKEYARIQTGAEDYTISLLLKRAYASCEMFMGKPIARVSATYYDQAKTERWRESVTTLDMPMYPFDESTLVITDVDGTVVDPATYYVEPETFLVRGKKGVLFARGPYQMTADIGLETSATYATREEPLLAQCILDVALMYYQQRSMNVTSESVSGTSVAYVNASLPERVKATLSQLRGFVLAP